MNEPINEQMRKDLFAEILPELEEIIEKAEKKAAVFKQAIEEAEADRQAGIRAKEAAKGVQSYAEAKQKIAEAENRKEFYQSKLDQLRTTPRMTEERYIEIQQEVKRVMLAERNKARQVCAEAMAILKQITDNYKNTAEEIDEFLEILDGAANILQSKSPTEWRLEAIRYAVKEAEKLFYTDTTGKINSFYEVIYHIVPRAYRDKNEDKDKKTEEI